jgi:hypothetical protein
MRIFVKKKLHVSFGEKFFLHSFRMKSRVGNVWVDHKCRKTLLFLQPTGL